MKKLFGFTAIILAGLVLFVSVSNADPVIPSDTDTLYRFSFVDVYGTTNGGEVIGEIYGLHWTSDNMKATEIWITYSPFTSEPIDVLKLNLTKGMNSFTTVAGIVTDGVFSTANAGWNIALFINGGDLGYNFFTYGTQCQQFVMGDFGFAAANFLDDFPVLEDNQLAVPEPASMLLLGLGLIGIAGIRRKIYN